VADGVAVVPRTFNPFVIGLSEPAYTCPNAGIDPCTDVGAGDGLVPLAGTDYGTVIYIVDTVTNAIVPGTATVSADGKTFTITLSTPLDENRAYDIVVMGCVVPGCKTGLLDGLGGSLGDANGLPAAEFRRQIRTPDPAVLSNGGQAGWATLAPMPASGTLPAERRDHSAVYVNGRLYVTGGLRADGTAAYAANQAYDPLTNTWINRASMSVARYAHAAAAFGTKLYIIGGASGTTTLSTLSIYDTTNNSWSTGTSMPQARRYAAAAVLNGKIYVAGGVDGAGIQQSTLFRYDPVTNTWSQMATMPAGIRSRLTLSAVGTGANGRLWAVGGAGTSQGTRVEVFDPNAGPTGAWTVGPGLPAQRSSHGAMVLNDYLYVVGGLNTSSVTQDTIYYYDTLLGVGGAWQAVAAGSNLPLARSNFGNDVVVLQPAPNPDVIGVLIVGGRTSAQAATSSLISALHE
jgi:N-acetylneuraminic acid mutarotase